MLSEGNHKGIYIMRYIGNTIKEYREKNGISLRKFANMLNVSFAYISYIENGKMIPSSAVIKKLAEVLGISEQEVTSQIYYKESGNYYRTYMTEDELRNRQNQFSGKKPAKKSKK